MTRQIVLIAHNLRSTHNVGSLLRTAEGLAVKTVYLTGYTPFPIIKNDPRLPHLANKIERQIHKTALGSEKLVEIFVAAQVLPLLESLKKEGFLIVALEQARQAHDLQTFKPPTKLAIVVGNELEGLEKAVRTSADQIVQIPMQGRKESFNVVQATAMALYHCRFVN